MGPILLLVVLSASPSPKRHLLTLPEIMRRMDTSPIRYSIKSTDDLDVDIADFGERLYPASVPPVDSPQVVVRDGRRVVVRAPCEAIGPMQPTAENLFQTKNYAAAGALYQEMMQKAPKCWIGFGYYGDALFFQGKIKEALPLYDQALELDPDEGALYTFRSNAYARLGRMKESLDDLRWSLALRPHHPGPTQVLRHLAQKGLVQFHDVRFEPRAYARADADGRGYSVYFDHQRPYWLAWGVCKALWLSDAEHRKAVVGREEHAFTSEEELECAVALLTAYEGERSKKGVQPDPQLEFLREVARGGDLDAWVAYELAARLDPQAILPLSPEAREKVFGFVKRHVVVDAR